MSPEEIQKKIGELTKRTEIVEKKKAALQGQLQAKKEELATLIQEIRAAGYDPKTLPAEKDRVQKELETDIVTYEKELSTVEQALEAFSAKK